jgi:hypothetical protein
MPETTIDYLEDYSAFQTNFKRTQVSGEEIGEVVMKMAGYFAKYNVRMGDALRHFSVIKANFQNQVDASTGKPMSSSKAEILSEATDEAAIYQMARIHVNNIQEMINGLKSLQKGVLFEYANAV